MNPHFKNLAFIAIVISSLKITGASLVKRSEKPWLELPNTPSLPTDCQEYRVKIDHATIWCSLCGVHSLNLPPVILLHGGFGNSDYYGSVIPLIKDREIIVMDTRAHGRSVVEDIHRELSFELYASDIVALLDHLDIAKAAFVGWSHMAAGTIAVMMDGEKLKYVDRAFLFGGYHNFKNTATGYTDSPTYKAFVERAPKEWIKYQPNGNLSAFEEIVLKLDSTLPTWTDQDLSKITLGDQVTVAFGQYEEAISPEEVKLLPTLIKGSKSVTIPNVSHFGMLQNPQAMADEINKFLSV